MNENTMMGQQDGSEGKNATSTLNYLSSTHRTHVAGRKDSCKLSSDLYMHTMVCA